MTAREEIFSAFTGWISKCLDIRGKKTFKYILFLEEDEIFCIVIQKDTKNVSKFFQ